MSLRIYTYSGCDGCRKALKYLAAKGVEVENLPIRETPPTRDELAVMLAAYDGKFKKLFNTSGRDYREQKLSATIDSLSQDQAFALLQSNGNLVKRPFLIGEGVAIVGFKPETWDIALT